MSEVFYRKWRPTRMDELVGQEPVSRTLLNAIDQGRIAHAYLFCGPRGTGKTSTARILSKAINCVSPEKGEPDNTCVQCQSIIEGRSLDIIEIDAASNRGIDDIRNLRERVKYSPTVGRYKVYIIDEVHMLTDPAFNALLKTLEEPPTHSIFILATTEAHKVPLTIISRCQRFDFRRISTEECVTKLSELSNAEGVDIGTNSLSLIARESLGSLRDAENLLERALISYGKNIDQDNILDMLGLTGDQQVLELVGYIVDKSVKNALRLINQISEDGVEPRQLRASIIKYLRDVMLFKIGAVDQIDCSDSIKETIQSFASNTSVKDLVYILKLFSEMDIGRDGHTVISLEIATVEASIEVVDRGVSAHVRKPIPADPEILNKQKMAHTNNISSENITSHQKQKTAVPDKSRQENITKAILNQDSPEAPEGRLEFHWKDILESLRLGKYNRFNMGALLRDCKEREIAGDQITLKFGHRSHMERMQEELRDPKSQKVLKDVLAKILEFDYELKIDIVNESINGPRQSHARDSYLVRSAMAMGAKIISETEEQSDDE